MTIRQNNFLDSTAPQAQAQLKLRLRVELNYFCRSSQLHLMNIDKCAGFN